MTNNQELKAKVVGAVTAWRLGDNSIIESYLQDEVFKSKEDTRKFVAICLDLIRFLENSLAAHLKEDPQETHERIGRLVANGQI